MSLVHTLSVIESRFHVCRLRAALGVIGLALLGAGQAQTATAASGMTRSVTDRDHAIYHPATNCGGAHVTVMTPRPGADLLPDHVASSPKAQAFYVRAAQAHVTWLDTVACEETNVTFKTGDSHDGQSTNWSGYQIGGAAAHSSLTTQANHYVQAAWVLPTRVQKATVDTSATGYYGVATWIGLGGSAMGRGLHSNMSRDHPLIQAGTHQQVNQDGSIEPPYFWFQIVPETAAFKIPIPISPGQKAMAVINWIPGSHTAGVGVCNLTTAKCANLNITGVAETSNVTEWIVEAPTIKTATGTTSAALAAFSPAISFTNGCWSPTNVILSPVGNSALSTVKERNQFTMHPYTGAMVKDANPACHGIDSGANLARIDMITKVNHVDYYNARPFSVNDTDFGVMYYPP
jgi:hypothetical protein